MLTPPKIPATITASVFPPSLIDKKLNAEPKIIVEAAITGNMFLLFLNL